MSKRCETCKYFAAWDKPCGHPVARGNWNFPFDMRRPHPMWGGVRCDNGDLWQSRRPYLKPVLVAVLLAGVLAWWGLS